MDSVSICEMTGGSLPTRERGLKRAIITVCGDRKPSLPTRERGLKPVFTVRSGLKGYVAPYAGAWIETHIPGL